LALFASRRCARHVDLHSFPTRRSSDLTGMNEEIRIQRLLIMIEAAGSEAGLSIDQLVEVVPGNKKVVQRCQPTEEFDVLNNDTRSEEHTSELQSRENLVCRLLLEEKRL